MSVANSSPGTPNMGTHYATATSVEALQADLQAQIDLLRAQVQQLRAVLNEPQQLDTIVERNRGYGDACSDSSSAPASPTSPASSLRRERPGSVSPRAGSAVSASSFSSELGVLPVEDQRGQRRGQRLPRGLSSRLRILQRRAVYDA